MKLCRASLVILTCGLAGAAAANAQIAGVLRGRILDGSGSAVANARVDLTQSSTSLHQSTLSTTTGDYVFINVASGSYRIDASAASFQHLTCTAITGSSRIEALNGLRMMPLFPPSSLKFRTAGFPQYGFKADISGGAFPLVLLLKPAPGIHSFFVSLLPPFVLIQTEAWYPALSRAGILSRYRHSSLTALPQGSSLQTGL
jgi:hypothetical protein